MFKTSLKELASQGFLFLFANIVSLGVNLSDKFIIAKSHADAVGIVSQGGFIILLCIAAATGIAPATQSLSRDKKSQKVIDELFPFLICIGLLSPVFSLVLSLFFGMSAGFSGDKLQLLIEFTSLRSIGLAFLIPSILLQLKALQKRAAGVVLLTNGMILTLHIFLSHAAISLADGDVRHAVWGLALAGVVPQIVSFALLTFRLHTSGVTRPKDFDPRPAIASGLAIQFLRKVAPISLETLVLIAGFNTVLTIVGRVSAQSVAVVALFYSLLRVVILPSKSFGAIAVVTMQRSGENKGDVDNEKSTLAAGWLLLTLISGSAAAWLLISPSSVLEALGLSYHDPSLLLGVRLAGIVVLFEPFAAFSSSVLSCLGHGKTVLKASVATQWGFYIPCIFFGAAIGQKSLSGLFLLHLAYRLLFGIWSSSILWKKVSKKSFKPMLAA